jgi:hypothetical protein
MTLREKQDTLRKIFWDAEISGDVLYSVLTGEQSHSAVSREKIFTRMLERLGWHTILDILGVEAVQSLLTSNVIAGLRHAEQRERYEFIRKILSGEAVSFTGWGDEYYQKIKHTLFSDRWYRSQQALL